jgi:uncharacterized C2H2 Zn-finger protein
VTRHIGKTKGIRKNRKEKEKKKKKKAGALLAVGLCTMN